MVTQLKERRANQKGGMEVVVIEAIHETGGVARISRVYDDNGDVMCFRVYKGDRIGGAAYRLSQVANRTTMVDAAWDFAEVCQKLLGVK